VYDTFYDDFYEPSEFDVKVEEWKKELRESVKQEVKDEIQRLRKEVERLTDIRDNWDGKIAELNDKINEAEHIKRNALTEAKKMTLKELLEPLKQEVWTVKCEWEYIREKCDKCDEYGYIRFKSPQGRELTEECSCREQKYFYSLIQPDLYEIRCNSKGKIMKFLFVHNRSLDEEHYVFADKVYNGQSFDSMYRCGSWYFYDKEKAQEYCDYLNKKVGW